MKLIKRLLVSVLLVFTLCSGTVLAKNTVSEIDIEVTVRDDGSAYIVQEWRGEFYEGTENYIPIATGDISISDLKVSDENGAYQYIDNWDIDASFDEKAYKCGINETADGVELCFGISEYGENRYAIEYVVTDFIKSYTDYDGTNFMFINPDMSTFPTDGHITILMQNGTQLTEENAAIWAFGYDGYVEFQNGKVDAWTTTSLSGNNSMIVMLRLNKGIVFPNASIDNSFDTVKDRAFEGSDYTGDYYYEEANAFEKFIGLLILFAFPVIVILIIVFAIKRKIAIKKFYKETEYFRDVPNGGNMALSHYLAQSFDIAKEKSHIIGALILSMINKGCIEPLTEENEGLFGKVKESVNLRLLKATDDGTEMSLYNVLVAAAGEDGTLQEKELEKYSYRNPEMIMNIISGTKESGRMAFVSLGGILKGFGNSIKNLSDKGKEELREVMGLKKYLEEFTLIDERSITETVIWKEYLVYATLFGNAEKVLSQLKKVYPERIYEFDDYNRNVIVANSYYRSMYRSSQRAIQARRSSGGGGRASFGGGGGFSGGGRGGGSR